MKLIFATNNAHKLQEVQQKIGSSFSLITLEQAGIYDELLETKSTLSGNALQKCQQVFELTKMPCFSDDTGLEVEALNGQPGVYSKRYAGEDGNSEKNIDKLLNELRDSQNRKARFKTVIALRLANSIHLFSGIVEGNIAKTRRGKDGFGYDPVFIPMGFTQSFAEMTLQEKNQISHRGRAIENLSKF
ncbi:MAG: RdgB/HAM1 family non-canonical purine NTP pyrophosphatase, partial [Bacteroidetes bacterium]|nr:RdgB/HAM1 family non-canonical purine NTP pyrophosphatase [Bacteroidota bacterium]